MAALGRMAVREVECPECEAKAGDRCRGVRGRERSANHRERMAAAKAAAANPSGRDWDEGLTTGEES